MVVTMVSKIKGIALITVMLVVALAAIVASQMMARLQLEMQRATNISFNQQAYWYAMGAEAFAKQVLKKAFEDEPDKAHLAQIWALGENSYPVDFGNISGEITDLHACFNLNALRVKPETDSGTTDNDTIPRQVLERLIVELGVEGVGQFEAENMTYALLDWLDADSNLSGVGGAEDNDYSGKEYPYLPANNFLADISELRVVEHFTATTINALKPFVCVLPNIGSNQMNINTIAPDKPELLQALLDISRVDAESILANRDSAGYDDVEAFFNSPEVSKLQLTQELKDQFVVDSEFFQLKTNASFNDSYFSMYSVMKVDKNNKISVISRKVGRN